jgi:hypothetical protein
MGPNIYISSMLSKSAKVRPLSGCMDSVLSYYYMWPVSQSGLIGNWCQVSCHTGRSHYDDLFFWWAICLLLLNSGSQMSCRVTACYAMSWPDNWFDFRKVHEGYSLRQARLLDVTTWWAWVGKDAKQSSAVCFANSVDGTNGCRCLILWNDLGPMEANLTIVVYFVNFKGGKRSDCYRIIISGNTHDGTTCHAISNRNSDLMLF